MNRNDERATAGAGAPSPDYVARSVLGLLFLVAGWNKMAFPLEFLSNLYEYNLVGPDTGLYIGATLPWVEFLLGFCLIANLLPTAALAAATTLLAGFVAVQTSALLQGLDISCGCFGDSGKVNYGTLLRTVLLLLFAGVTLYAVTLRNGRRPASG